MSREENLAIARRWIDAFNAHDVPRLLSLYADDARHTSPKIRLAHPETGGQLLGKAALEAWWTGAVERLPQLQYVLTRLTADEEVVFMEYVRKTPGEADLPVAEAFEVRDGRIVASRVFHG